MGGVHVTIGDEVIDGTIASRLEQARRAVLG
jgi:F0F1-type ATP synthase delta subunit